jgi:competence protein ComEC
MGFRAEKLKIEQKIKIIKRVLLCVVAGITLAICVFSAFVPAASWKYYVSKPQLSKREEGELRIHFINVGQGDATLLELPDGKTMLIDGGNDDTTKVVMRYLNALKIKTIDYLVATHTDSDHCGGLDSVVKYKEVKSAYIPNVNAGETTKYAQFYNQLCKENCIMSFSSRSEQIQGENYKLSFLYPYTYGVDEEKKKDDSNVESAVLWLDYNGVNALFMGDAPVETEEILLRDNELGLLKKRQVDLTSIEILKVAHHGSAYSTSEKFLSTIGVKTAVISCGQNNLYKHPANATLQRLQDVNAEILRTDEQGHIIITIKNDGNYIVELI